MRTILAAETNPHLREVAHAIPLADIQSAHVKKLIADMKRLLSKEEFGVALAAPQLGEPLRLFIVSGRALSRGKRNAPDEEAGEENDEDEKIEAANAPTLPDQVYINPKLEKLSRGRTDKHEGCLSIRGVWGTVPRAEKATIRAYDEEGRTFTRGASGFLAHIFQHEMDHLEGILYTDKATHLYDETDDDNK